MSTVIVFEIIRRTARIDADLQKLNHNKLECIRNSLSKPTLHIPKYIHTYIYCAMVLKNIVKQIIENLIQSFSNFHFLCQTTYLSYLHSITA